MPKNNETGIADQRKRHSSERAKTTTADRILTPKPEWSPRGRWRALPASPCQRIRWLPERAVPTCVPP